MRFRINWTESVGYVAYVEADSKQEALNAFHESGADVCIGQHVEPDGFCEIETDSVEAEEDPA